MAVDGVTSDLDPSVVGRRVRRHRRAAGLSQVELADRAGVSRQAIGALEAGRHLPRVDAALALAKALRTTVEDLLAVGPPRAMSVLDEPLADGSPVRVARVGDHTVCVPIPADADGEVWPAPDAVIYDGRVQVFEDTQLDGFVLVGCDPAIGILASLAPARGAGRILPVAGSSAAARLALTVGRAHAAVVHDAAPPTPRDPTRVHRLRLAAWRTGLAADPSASGVLAAALVGEGAVVQRESGAASQSAYERAVMRAAGRVPPGPRAMGHLDAARRAIRSGMAAVTIEPVARALELAFHPLETHTVEVWIDAGAVEHPGARALGDVLASARLRARLAAIPGYDISRAPAGPTG